MSENTTPNQSALEDAMRAVIDAATPAVPVELYEPPVPVTIDIPAGPSAGGEGPLDDE